MDQLKDFVLSNRQKIPQAPHVHKVEESEEIELDDNYEYSVSFNVKLEESENGYKTRGLDNPGNDNHLFNSF